MIPAASRLLPFCAIFALLPAGCKTAPVPEHLRHEWAMKLLSPGKFVHAGTPVVLWMDPGGYDAYRVERRFSAF